MNKDTILAFHIGRGGRFHNSGYLSFIGEANIGDFTNDLYAGYENEKDFKNRLGYNESFGGVKSIIDCFSDRDTDTLLESYGISEKQLGEYIYKDSNGEDVGLTEEDVEKGIGRIDIDGDYDTTYTTYLKDLNRSEVAAIKRCGDYVADKAIDTLLELNGFEISKYDDLYIATNKQEEWTGEECESEEDAKEQAYQYFYDCF